MHAALASTAFKQTPNTLRSLPLVLKREVNLHRTLKSPRRVSHAQATNNSTLAFPSTGPTFQSSTRRTTLSNNLTWSQIRSILVSSSIPMIGFGIMDNVVMIQAGGYIDSTLGIQFGLATLTAAAMGQVVSDVSGVLFGGSLERLLSPYVKAPQLTSAQWQLPVVSRLRLLGSVGGVILGCMLGATSLYFVLDEDSARPMDHLLQLQGVVQDLVVQEIHGVTKCVMHVKGASHSLPQQGGVAVIPFSKEGSMAMACSEEGQPLMDGDRMCIPIFRDDEVVAVMELLSNANHPFSLEEELAAQRVARNVGIFMGHMMNRK